MKDAFQGFLMFLGGIIFLSFMVGFVQGVFG